MQSSQDFTDVLDDQTKNLNNILQHDEDDIINGSQSFISDSQYFTETDYLSMITTEKLTDQNSLKVISLNISS